MQGRAQRLRYSEGSNAGYDDLAGAARLLWRSGPGALLQMYGGTASLRKSQESFSFCALCLCGLWSWSRCYGGWYLFGVMDLRARRPDEAWRQLRVYTRACRNERGGGA